MGKIFRKHEGGCTIGSKSLSGLPGRRIINLLAVIVILTAVFQAQYQHQSASATAGSSTIYLPFIAQNHPASKMPVFHIPFIDEDESYNLLTTRYTELGVLWFGKVTPTDNSTDVRIGYTQNRLVIDVASIDQQLWYDSSTPPSKDFSAWDSVSVFLGVPGPGGETRLIRLDAAAALNKFYWDDRADYQAAYQWNGSQWTPLELSFRTDHSYKGYFNEPEEDDGWNVSYRIPLSGLGFATPPSSGAALTMGVIVYDRDTATGSLRSTSWPDGFQPTQSASYGQFTFGYPAYPRPLNPLSGTTTIKRTSTVMVEDASVGGYATCGDNGRDKWTEWGNRVYNSPPENQVAVIQNQQLIADWPCFSRYYITFPLGQIPNGKVILSAKLTMMHFGGSNLAEAKPSYIQVFRINQPWNPGTISWNNAPQAVENYPGIWVEPYDVIVSGAPAVARTWDVTRAMVDVYGTGEPLRLALYSADRAMHSGKYFNSSETGSPPTLTIEWGNP